MDPEHLIMIEPEDCELYQLPEGILLIGRSDPFESMGFVDLNPQARLPRISRPVIGMYRQIAGSSIIKLYDANGITSTKTLQTGEQFDVPAGIDYTVENAGLGKCLVFWKYAGDISVEMEKLKRDLPHLPPKPRESSGYKDMFEQYQKRMEEKQGDY